MRKDLLIAVFCTLASATSFGANDYQPLNVKTGLWQVTEHIVAQGLPPAMAAMVNHNANYQTCVTPQALKKNPFSDEKCNWTLIKSTSSDMEVKGTACDLGKNDGTSAAVHNKLHAVDSEHVNGSGDWASTFEGQAVSGTVSGSGHWVASSCGDVQ